jgi:hypothetical protein
MKDKRNQKQPKEQFKDDEDNQADKDTSDSEDEECQITFPTRRDGRKILLTSTDSRGNRNGNGH